MRSSVWRALTMPQAGQARARRAAPLIVLDVRIAGESEATIVRSAPAQVGKIRAAASSRSRLPVVLTLVERGHRFGHSGE
jgi:hypothetical protein